MSLPFDPLGRAYLACEELARSHYENFPVASRLLPRAARPHVAAVYAFARVADDIADEGSALPSDRIEQLDAWKRRLHAALAAQRSSEPPQAHGDLILLAVANSIRTLDLPIALFDDLLSAFRQDTMTTRYTSWADVFDYCRRSANPIGRLVLRIAGYRDDTLDRSSDALCTALQLTNFWQDFGRDWRAGRLYVPLEVQRTFGAGEEQLTGRALGDAWVRAIGECVRVTLECFRAGRDVCGRVHGRLRYELRFTWTGGHRVLEQVDAMTPSLMTIRPTLGASDVPLLLWRVARWSGQV